MAKLFVLLLSLFLLSCNEKENIKNKVEDEHEHKHGHSHDPHYGGVLFELGDHFAHIEIVVSLDKLVIYILDGAAENNLYLKESELKVSATYKDSTSIDLALSAVANPLTGETVGHTSQFETMIPLQTQNKEIFAVKIYNLTIKGQQFKEVTLEMNK